MAVKNPWTITYASNVASPAAGEQVGGSSDVYLLHGPYVIEKTFETIRIVFDVVVVAETLNEDTDGGLQQLSDALETAFRKRDRTIKIDLNGTAWTYTFGTDILNTRASIDKSGDSETDRGLSRMYRVEVAGELPADDNDGLRDLSVSLDYAPGRQKRVAFEGVYTRYSGSSASAQYASDFDAEAATILTAIDGSATFELVDESFDRDRNDHVCTFRRSYVELLVNQSAGSLDDTDIRDHEVTFTDLVAHPGDAGPDIPRMRRCIANYQCAIDIDQTTDLHTVYNNKVRDHIKSLFETNFEPSVFCVEDERVSYDETSKRMSAQLQFYYQTGSGQVVVEVSQTIGYRESRAIDYTPLHANSELAFVADPGWATIERVGTRVVTILGSQSPNRRIGGGSGSRLSGMEGGKKVTATGWNIISSNSVVESRWVGNPNDTQIQLSTLTETVVERLTKKK